MRKKFNNILNEGKYKFKCPNCDIEISFNSFSDILDDNLVKKLKENRKNKKKCTYCYFNDKTNIQLECNHYICKICLNSFFEKKKSNFFNCCIENYKEKYQKIYFNKDERENKKNISIKNLQYQIDKKYTNCKYCTNRLMENSEDSVNLNCGHTICLQCTAYSLSKFFIKNGITSNIFNEEIINFVCPKCYKNVSILNLTKNLYSNLLNLSNKEIFCDICDSNKIASFKCKTELKNLCNSCFKLYHNKTTNILFKDHKIENAVKNRICLNCSTCLMSNCKSYSFCYDCKTIICVQCLENHILVSKDHRVTLIDDSFLLRNSYFEKKYNLKFKEISQIIEKEFNFNIDIIRKIENENNLALARKVDDIKKKLDIIVADCIEKSNNYINEINKKKDLIHKCYKNLGNTTKSLILIESIGIDQLFNFEKPEIQFEKFELNYNVDFTLALTEIYNNLNDLQEILNQFKNNSKEIFVKSKKNDQINYIESKIKLNKQIFQKKENNYIIWKE